MSHIREIARILYESNEMRYSKSHLVNMLIFDSAAKNCENKKFYNSEIDNIVCK